MATTEEPKEKPEYSEVLGNQMISIYVGRKRKHFHVHRKILCLKAPRIGSLLPDEDVKALEQVLFLPTEDTNVFDLFTEWLYMDRFRPIDMSKHTPTSGPIYVRVKLYCFAERRGLKDLMDYTASSILAALARFNKRLSVEASVYAFEHTSSTSPIRILMTTSVHWALRRCNESKCTIKSLQNALVACPDLGAAVLAQIRAAGATLPDVPEADNWCKYHVHGKDQACGYPDAVSLGEI